MILNTICSLRAPALRVSGLDGDVDVNPDDHGNKFVLSWLIQHAMDHGGVGLKLGVCGSSGDSWLFLLGPHWHQHPGWWELVAPGPENYPFLLQACLSHAALELGYPSLRGQLRVIRNKKKAFVNLEIKDMNSFQLTWDKSLALPRASVEREGPVFPEE
ncbi:MAG: hypothetical protein KDA54_03170 [Phycisphaerales bacterium]|nr:hypothetical protein [Phycisphaerales bacterium]